ncbi:plastocyanin/azurin family copper-binding protein [Natrinema sp. 1APR25-10V2]|uniref:plastocyanin/azurin family copper-binding protein n=1 Tax=Natrinema sp. 1APR25-10V2 TaxID=2951081 RepID=UPI00287B7126|nr:plastocyanin/azurin family copper-binding protein [Natrinema sp. 1APR25-10V2]
MTGDFGFDPEMTTIETGQTVTWVNSSDVDHTITAYEAEIPDGATYFASGGFESERAARERLSEGLVPPDSEYEHTFETAGTYEYYCVPHESSEMVGTVRVE